MKKRTILKNAQLVNEGKIYTSDVLIKNGIVSKISTGINALNAEIVDCDGQYLMPGMIDD